MLGQLKVENLIVTEAVGRETYPVRLHKIFEVVIVLPCVFLHRMEYDAIYTRRL